MSQTKMKTGTTRTPAVFSPELARAMRPGEIRHFGDVADLASVEDDNYRATDPARLAWLRGSILESGVTDPLKVEVLTKAGDVVRVRWVDGHHRKTVVADLRREAVSDGQPWLYRPLPVVVECREEGTGERKAALKKVVGNLLHMKDGVVARARAIREIAESSPSTTNTQIGATLGMDRRTVERHLLVLTLPPEILALAEGEAQHVKESSLYEIARLLKNTGEKTAAELFENRLHVLEEKGMTEASPEDAALALVRHDVAVAKGEETPIKAKAVRRTPPAEAADAPPAAGAPAGAAARGRGKEKRPAAHRQFVPPFPSLPLAQALAAVDSVFASFEAEAGGARGTLAELAGRTKGALAKAAAPGGRGAGTAAAT